MKHSAEFLACPGDMKIGIGKNFDPTTYPINGLRHPPEKGTTGWYIWSGTEFSEAPDFFVPLHASHLQDVCPAIQKYLGLPAGWRFLIAPGQEDVWFDQELLNI